MNRKDECQELYALLRSRFPVILIESNEEPRILELLQQAANLENQVLMTWSITHGIRRHGRDEAIYQTNDLLDALKHIDKTPQNGVYVMCDAHPGFKDPVSMRLIREIALSHYRSARTLVFVSPRLDELPPEILRLSAHFHPTLPNRDDIRALVVEEARRYESQSGEKPRGDRHALEMLIMHLLGMEQDDVRRLVRQALRDDGAIDADDVRRVLATKYEALGGSATLAYEESKVRFDDVGGLERLKHWITLRRTPFIEAGADIDRPKGIVLLGVQGGGKSLAARAIAGQWGVPLMRMDFGALYNKYYGETERNLRNAFAAAETMSPCVLWIDEIEKGIATDSGEGDGGVSRRVLGTLLTWMAERTRTGFHRRHRERHLAAAAGTGTQGPLRRDFLRRPSGCRMRARRSHAFTSPNAATIRRSTTSTAWCASPRDSPAPRSNRRSSPRRSKCGRATRCLPRRTSSPNSSARVRSAS